MGSNPTAAKNYLFPSLFFFPPKDWKKNVMVLALSGGNQWLSGLGVWFLLWVQEVPGSNPGWALLIFFYLVLFSFEISSGEKKSLLGDTRIWTRDLPDCSRVLYHWAISPIVLETAGKLTLGVRNIFLTPKKLVVRKGIRTPALRRGPEFSFLLPIRKQGLHLESGALDHSAILTGYNCRLWN